MEVKIAVPLGAENKVFHDDPWSAPLFAIYSVTENDDKLIYNCIAQKENPWVLEDENIVFDPSVCTKGSGDIVKNSPNHLLDHHIILEVLSGCSYLIAQRYCSNVEKAVTNGGIEIYNLPPIVKEPDLAVKSLLVNLNFTNNVQNIQKRTKEEQ